MTPTERVATDTSRTKKAERVPPTMAVAHREALRIGIVAKQAQWRPREPEDQVHAAGGQHMLAHTRALGRLAPGRRGPHQPHEGPQVRRGKARQLHDRELLP
ncbi:hypothetical protein [Variovorax sp. CF313]|jgi:hypothetical protein|uniref:hypothetical protein n=1 Tax=Variovorax sp. CF313 TaxID=1144315 RepID=UPI001ED97EF4|nr:hypothetical protein [Variovorax sp. CF313]